MRSINAKDLREFCVPVSEIRPGTREPFVWDGTKFPEGCPGKRECTELFSLKILCRNLRMFVRLCY